jgi:pimeloyl-ACP methyl ester carboxylesterase
MDITYVVLPTTVVLVLSLAIYWGLRRVWRLERSGYSKVRQWVERMLLYPFTLVCIVVAGSTAFNAIALYWYRHPPPGRLYQIDGHTMRMQCMGTGSPTIVLEAGAGNDGLTWAGIQPQLATHTQVCSYDRAGMGWSDPRHGPRDADHVAAELHELLASAHIETPVILLGHSRGGLFIRDYTAHYPSEVAGLSFEDSSTPLQNRDPAVRAFDEPRRASRFSTCLNEALFVLGAPRLIVGCSGKNDPVIGVSSRVFHEDRCHQPYPTIEAEDKAFDLSGQETANTGPFGPTPIMILSHDPAVDPSYGIPKALIQAGERNQNDLLKLSTRSYRIIAKGSGHFIHIQRPDLVEREVIDFVEEIRRNTPNTHPAQSVTVE